MAQMNRRLALGLLAGAATTAAAVGASRIYGWPQIDAQWHQATENDLAGEDWWPKNGPPDADDEHRQIQGYASSTSINLGESLDFHVSVNPTGSYKITIYRLGWYGGAGARRMLTSPDLQGANQPLPPTNPDNGLIACDWPASWSLQVPNDWTSGLYQAVFTSADGWRSCTPFVVRDDQATSALCVALPVTTWQAYNQWPLDGRNGTSLYNGYKADGGMTSDLRATQVSFDRPYSNNGMPSRFDDEIDAIQWLERSDYDITYATSLDLHSGRLDPKRFRGIVFCGHDEYWTTEMRQAADQAVAGGTSLVVFSANSLYWRILLEEADGRPAERNFSCTKVRPEPGAATNDATCRWRDLDAPEAALLGVQYNGIVHTQVPLVVQQSDHWIWAGSGVSDGDQIPKVVGGEADGLFPDITLPSDTVAATLSASPYQDRQGTSRIQNTHVYEKANGAVVFAAGSLHWTRALNRPGWKDERITTATENLLNRIIAGPSTKATDPDLGPTTTERSRDPEPTP